MSAAARSVSSGADVGLRVWGFRVQGFRVYGFRVHGLGSRVHGG